ncbi:hypothetical protein CLAIMM_00586 [Cladophialophora immunda]|nr:hypothetical protein CLAIMM_00586 [Cladophialophora immunda]
MGSVVIPHLVTGWHVDQAILSEDERLVVIRFGRDWDPDCMRQDEVLYKIADRVKNFAVIYVCDLDQVPDFKQMYELYDPVTLMFFFRNKHMMCDFGTGNNNKLNWVLEDKQELIDIIETIYKGAKKVAESYAQSRKIVFASDGGSQSREENLQHIGKLRMTLWHRLRMDGHNGNKPHTKKVHFGTGSGGVWSSFVYRDYGSKSL